MDTQLTTDATATNLKRFFKRRYGIPVRVQSSKHFVVVRIAHEPPRPELPRYSQPLVYKHSFPPALGNKCMRLVYAGHESLCQQEWGGNITSHNIGMRHAEWQQLLENELKLEVASDNC